MPAKPRLTPEQWAQVRRIWERDPRPGYSWLIEFIEIEISPQSIGKRARSEGWVKANKSSADKGLGNSTPKQPRKQENAPKRASARGAKSNARQGGEGVSSHESEGVAGDKPAAPKRSKTVNKRTTKAKPKRGFKKTEQGAPEGSADPRADGFSAETSETFDSDDRETQWGGSQEIDIVRSQFGRPPEYRHEYAAQARKLYLLGATDEKVADFFDVSVRTLHRWKNQHPEFCHAVKAGKLSADADVAASLYHRAIGMSMPKTHVSTYLGRVILTDMVENIPPDVGAIRTWLFNRQPELWKAEPEPPAVDLTSKVPDNNELEDIYAQSRQASKRRAMQARERNERLGVIPGAASVSADAKLMPKRNVKPRKPDVQDVDLEGQD